MDVRRQDINYLDCWVESICIRMFWFCKRFWIVVFMKDIKSIIFCFCPIACWEVIIFGSAHRACGFNVGFLSHICTYSYFWARSKFARSAGHGSELCKPPQATQIYRRPQLFLVYRHSWQFVHCRETFYLCGSSTAILLCNRNCSL